MPLPDPEPDETSSVAAMPATKGWPQMLRGRRWILLAIAAVLIVSLVYIASRNIRLSDPTVGDVVSHMEQAGIKGTFRPTFAVLLNAKEGGAYVGPDFEFDILKFDDESQARSLEKSGLGKHPCHRNGKIILIVHKGDDQKIVAIFKRF